MGPCRETVVGFVPSSLKDLGSNLPVVAVDRQAERLLSASQDHVTRFGEISPLWEICNSLWPFWMVQIEFGKMLSLLC